MVITKQKKISALLIFVEISLFLALIVGLFSFTFAGVGQNVTVITQLTVGNVFPEIMNVSLESGASSVVLIANSTKLVSCMAVIRDYNGEADINTTNATFFDNVASTLGSADDNNTHYSNSSCNISTNFGSFGGYNDDEYSALANCSFFVLYNANPQTWNCTIQVNDTYNWKDADSDSITIEQLLSISLPNVINYGLVNATYVSDEQTANVTNVGNVKVNLSLEGYAQAENDGLAMNCTLGSNGTIPVEYEKYNLTLSNPGQMTLTQAEGNYSNLTTNPVVKSFNLDYRQQEAFNEAINATYWRIYVPLGVAGNCTGNIKFGATVAAGS